MLPHSLTNFEIQKYCQNKPRFNGVYGDNLLKTIKDGTYITNLDECANWHIGLYWRNIEIIYFHSFGVEYVPEKIYWE